MDGPDLQSKKNAIGRSVFRLRCIELELLFHDGVTLVSARVLSAYVLKFCFKFKSLKLSTFIATFLNRNNPLFYLIENIIEAFKAHSI
jgi:hypothetical protein